MPQGPCQGNAAHLEGKEVGQGNVVLLLILGCSWGYVASLSACWHHTDCTTLVSLVAGRCETALRWLVTSMQMAA